MNDWMMRFTCLFFGHVWRRIQFHVVDSDRWVDGLECDLCHDMRVLEEEIEQ